MKYLSILFAAVLLYSCSEQPNGTEVPETSGKINWAISNFPKINKKPKHKVMTLGVFHFNRSTDGSDVVAKNHIDITSNENQNELDLIIEKLKGFRPSKIAVEFRPEYQSLLDSLYNEYLMDNYELGKNETFQIGFKLAKILGHDRVYCVDNNPPMPQNISEIDDWVIYADSLGHKELWHSYDQENLKYNTYMDTIQRHLNLTDYLMLINSKENLIRTKQLWTTGIVNVGHSHQYLGADLLGRWYRRNSRIYANAKNLPNPNTNENLLVIYGGAHKWILDELFRSSPDFELMQFNELMLK